MSLNGFYDRPDERLRLSFCRGSCSCCCCFFFFSFQFSLLGYGPYMRGISLWRLIMFIFFPLSDNNSRWNCTSVKALTVSCAKERRTEGIENTNYRGTNTLEFARLLRHHCRCRLDIKILSRSDRIKSSMTLLFLGPI